MQKNCCNWPKRARDGGQARRLLALVAILEGENRTEAARIGGMDLQTLRDWVLRFNAQGSEGLKNRKPKGPEPRLNEEQLLELKELVIKGPDLKKMVLCAGVASIFRRSSSSAMARTILDEELGFRPDMIEHQLSHAVRR